MTFAASTLMLVREGWLHSATEVPTANEFGFINVDPTPWWEELFPFVVLGLIMLPVALVVVWLLHRIRLDRFLLTNSTIAAALSVISFLMLRTFNMLVFQSRSFQEALSEAIQFDGEFRAIIATIFIVGSIGSFIFGWWLRWKRASLEFWGGAETFK